MFLDLNSKELYQSSGKEKKVVVLLIKPIAFLPSPLNLSLSQQENTPTLGATRFKPSARFIHEKTKIHDIS